MARRQRSSPTSADDATEPTHQEAVDELQAAIDATAKDGDARAKRKRLRRAVQAEREARERS